MPVGEGGIAKLGSAGRCQALLDQWQKTLSQGLWWGQASKCLVILRETTMPSGDSPGKMLRTIHKERAGEAPEPWCDESESPDETSGQPIGISLGDPDGPSPGELLVLHSSVTGRIRWSVVNSTGWRLASCLVNPMAGTNCFPQSTQ